ncbi:MAG: methylenetetrahydrofolate reductase [Bacteroides sp.]|nr:methylenetetrahydrofolate reductase [Bacteroides sp.]MCM1379942.1 methylenetetrahydrofolate reductase [Bacteroides sp.]MCM1446203.1 methylenetetrahydrofolate reductase [Prevotella sp.]
MTVVESINSASGPIFSFEILPPLKGNDIQTVYNVIDRLREFDPKYINITSHHNDAKRKRPGTVAIAAAIQYRYGIPAVPHIICKGFSKEETESALIDLNYLGIHNLLLLRGDEKCAPRTPGAEYHAHAMDLQAQVNEFNRGVALDGTEIKGIDTPFNYGMACYPEVHAEAESAERDIAIAKAKVDAGAQYLVTQMFFNNEKYYSFVDKCRLAGIKVPIIPGLKPIVNLKQRTLLPQVFACELPDMLKAELCNCKSDNEVIEVGAEWCIMQSKDLIAHQVPGLHYYTLMASESVKRIAKEVF